MLYIVECGFADPLQEAAWNAWYITSSPEFFLGAPRSSVASGAWLEPGDPRGEHWPGTYETDI